MANNKPIDVLRDGSLKATMWENNGENGPWYNTEVVKIYKDKDGNFQETHALSGVDNLRASELHRQAYHREIELRRENKHARDHDEEVERSRAGRAFERSRGPRRSR